MPGQPSRTCAQCAVGKFQSTNCKLSAVCTSCPEGRVQPSAGQGSCNVCAAGTYDDGDETCAFCPNGWEQPRAGQTSCLFPTAAPTRTPTPRPTARPTSRPSARPTPAPTPRPSPRPSPAPTPWPSTFPTTSPTNFPTREPSLPTRAPTPDPCAPPRAHAVDGVFDESWRCLRGARGRYTVAYFGPSRRSHYDTSECQRANEPA